MAPPASSGAQEDTEAFPVASLMDMLQEHWLYIVAPVCLLLSPLAYLALARLLPAAALLLASLLLFGAILAVTLLVAPMDTYITWQRRLEVFGYRAAAALVTYLLVGVGVAVLINQLSTQVIPLGWPVSARYVPFWPFYLYLVLGCGPWAWLGCPPPPG
ncbi:MAG: hypothetical protein R3185_00145 [Candidatus Thermoplasmatota archaeon]|nr:hypothetical protein [Candidatus Thermoplasmatota archaeon]